MSSTHKKSIAAMVVADDHTYQEDDYSTTKTSSHDPLVSTTTKTTTTTTTMTTMKTCAAAEEEDRFMSATPPPEPYHDDDDDDDKDLSENDHDACDEEDESQPPQDHNVQYDLDAYHNDENDHHHYPVYDFLTDGVWGVVDDGGGQDGATTVVDSVTAPNSVVTAAGGRRPAGVLNLPPPSSSSLLWQHAPMLLSLMGGKDEYYHNYHNNETNGGGGGDDEQQQHDDHDVDDHRDTAVLDQATTTMATSLASAYHDNGDDFDYHDDPTRTYYGGGGGAPNYHANNDDDFTSTSCFSTYTCTPQTVVVTVIMLYVTITVLNHLVALYRFIVVWNFIYHARRMDRGWSAGVSSPATPDNEMEQEQHDTAPTTSSRSLSETTSFTSSPQLMTQQARRQRPISAWSGEVCIMTNRGKRGTPLLAPHEQSEDWLNNNQDPLAAPSSLGSNISLLESTSSSTPGTASSTPGTTRRAFPTRAAAPQSATVITPTSESMWSRGWQQIVSISSQFSPRILFSSSYWSSWSSSSTTTTTPSQPPPLEPVEMFPSVHVSYTGCKNTSCPICLQDFYENEYVTACDDRGGCNILFHKECLFDWLDRADTCPCCRKDMLSPQYSLLSVITSFLGY